jgi:hypothetical protein
MPHKPMNYRLIAPSRGLPLGLPFCLMLLALFVSPAHAQRGGGFAFAPAGRTASALGASLQRGGPVRGHALRMRRGRHIFTGSGFGPNFYPYYDPYDYDDVGDRTAEPPPSRIIVQTVPPAAPSPAQANPPKPAESLVVELRGDHWVRLSGSSKEFNGQFFDPSGDRTPPPALPPAVLVFRDGHQEEAAKYTIVGPTINIKSDYWTTGSWTRSVPIAQLDLPATLRLNQSRGANFRLPSRPGEVMMRP